MEQKQTNGMAVASLVLGIVSAVCIFFGYFAFIGIITGIVGLVLGVMAKKKQPCGMATAGIVLSAVALGPVSYTHLAPKRLGVPPPKYRVSTKRGHFSPQRKSSEIKRPQ